MGDGFLVSQIAACQYDPPPTTPPATPSTRSSRFLTVTPSLTFLLFSFVQNPKCFKCFVVSWSTMYYKTSPIPQIYFAPNWILLDKRAPNGSGSNQTGAFARNSNLAFNILKKLFWSKNCTFWLKNLRGDICWSGENVEQRNYESNPLFRLGYSLQADCFQDLSRLGKSLSTLWSIREPELKEMSCQQGWKGK